MNKKILLPLVFLFMIPLAHAAFPFDDADSENALQKTGNETMPNDSEAGKNFSNAATFGGKLNLTDGGTTRMGYHHQLLTTGTYTVEYELCIADSATATCYVGGTGNANGSTNSIAAIRQDGTTGNFQLREEKAFGTLDTVEGLHDDGTCHNLKFQVNNTNSETTIFLNGTEVASVTSDDAGDFFAFPRDVGGSSCSFTVDNLVFYEGTVYNVTAGTPADNTNPELVGNDAWCTSCNPLQKITNQRWITEDTTPVINLTTSEQTMCAIFTNQTGVANSREPHTTILFEDFESGWETSLSDSCDATPDCTQIGGFNNCNMTTTNDFLFCASSDSVPDTSFEGTYGLVVEDWDSGTNTSIEGIWHNFNPSTILDNGYCDYISVETYASENGLDTSEFCWVQEHIEGQSPNVLIEIDNAHGTTWTKHSSNLSAAALSSTNVSVRIMCDMNFAGDDVYFDNFNISCSASGTYKTANLNYTDMIAQSGTYNCTTTDSTDHSCTIPELSTGYPLEVCVGCKDVSSNSNEKLNATFCADMGIFTFEANASASDPVIPSCLISRNSCDLVIEDNCIVAR